MDTKLFVRNQPGGFFSAINRADFPSGTIFWVGSTVTGASDAAGFGQNPDAPFATLDYAIGKCTASKGDVIYLLPGHAENIASATGCVLDVAGVTVIGLGSGALRPTLTITTATTATISITAANCWIENVLIMSNFLNIAAAMTLAATATGTTLKNVEMRDTSIVLGALIQISVAALCSDLTIDGFKFLGITAGLTAPATNVILCAGAVDRFTFTNSRIHCFTTAAAVALAVAVSVNIDIENVRLVQYETGAGLGIVANAGTTGYVDNVIGINLSNTVKPVQGAALAVGPNVRYSNAAGAYAGLYSYTVDS